MTFFDDLGEQGKTEREREADRFARDALIPPADWKSAKLSKRSSIDDVLKFAEKLRISPAIVAGRVRFESRNYTLYRSLIGARSARAFQRSRSLTDRVPSGRDAQAAFANRPSSDRGLLREK